MAGTAEHSARRSHAGAQGDWHHCRLRQDRQERRQPKPAAAQLDRKRTLLEKLDRSVAAHRRHHQHHEADKYDWYLADVFLRPAASDKLKAEVFLNNALLENGQAVRKDEWEFRDWEPDFAKAM